MASRFSLNVTAPRVLARARNKAHAVRNYFNYFTEIEERFQKRRGSLLLLSTLDWALIETWHEAGIPLEADSAFYLSSKLSGSATRHTGT